MRSTLDRLEADSAELALARGVDIAAEPAVITHGDSSSAQTISRHLDLAGIIEFAARTNNVDPRRLGAMTFLIHGGELEKTDGALNEPAVVKGAVRYPLITINTANNRTIDFLNFTILHELRHVFQPDERPIYMNRLVRLAVRGIGAIGVAASAASVVPFDGPLIENVDPRVSFPVFAVSSALAYMGRQLLWTVSKQERDANSYARRHGDFEPIKGIAISSDDLLVRVRELFDRHILGRRRRAGRGQDE